MDASQIGLVGDIGRHSVRFALSGGPQGTAPRETRSYHTADHATFASALLAYLTEMELRDQPLSSVLAVAGVARGDLINLTGSRWYISLSGIQSVLRVPPIALNEAAASAMALTALPQSALWPTGGPPARPVQIGGNYLLVGIGTGLGVAALVTTPQRQFAPIQSEAGHMSFSPSDSEEEKFAAAVRPAGPVRAELLLSAAGLVAAYAALAPDGRTAETPEDVTKGIGRDPVSTAVGRMLAGYLGSYIGDLVLAFGTWDGVFLTGAIGRALQSQLSLPRFRMRLETKGAYRRQLGEVPVSIVTRSDLELLGAAALLASG